MSCIYAEELYFRRKEGQFKWVIKFYLDGIDGEKVLLAQFYFGGIIVLAQFYFYYKLRRTIELIQFYNTLGRLFHVLYILYSLIHNDFMLWVWSKSNFEYLTKYL
jgi:hypothetical protein